MKTFLSCYFYPSTVVCVDDDTSLLKWLRTLLEAHNKVLPFHDPFSAATFLKAQETLLAEHHSRSDHFDMAHLKVDKIHELIYDEHRSDEISTLIVDYYMPGIDGLSFCRDLQDKAYEKIMLTGEADQKIAVAAFNEGIIDQFVMKGQPDVMKKVVILAQKMQRQFFINKTHLITESLLKFEPETFNYFMDADCCEKIHSLLAENNIQELYLFNDNSDYLLIDTNNTLWWLSVKNQQNIKNLTREAKRAFLEEPSEEAKTIYETIASGKKLPLFVLSKENLEINDWQDILVAPHEIKTSQDTYQVLLAKDQGKAALRYKDIRFIEFI